VLLFLQPHSDKNIDVARLHLVGTQVSKPNRSNKSTKPIETGRAATQYVDADALAALGATKTPLSTFNVFSVSEHMARIQQETSALLFWDEAQGQMPDDKKNGGELETSSLAAVAEMVEEEWEDSGLRFYCHIKGSGSEADNNAAAFLRALFVGPEHTGNIFGIREPGGACYMLKQPWLSEPTSEISASVINRFCEAFAEGKVGQHFKSGVRRPNDRFPLFPSLLHVVGTTVRELVWNMSTPTLFLVTNGDYFTPGSAPDTSAGNTLVPVLASLAEILASRKDKVSVNIAVLDFEANDPQVLGHVTPPALYWLSGGGSKPRKATPVRAPLNVVGLLRSTLYLNRK
jgi:hypothetical protein